MRRSDIVEATVKVLREAETSLPLWVIETIMRAKKSETNAVARSHLEFILQNIDIAQRESLPICQDTGLPIFRLEQGRLLEIDFDLHEAISEGVRVATDKVPLRPNVVDPISRHNTGDNVGEMIPDISLEMVEGGTLRMTVLPKGAGSENMSLIGMLNPADDPFEFIVQCVLERAANACPPLFLGIGIGGTFDLAARLAKRALFNMPGTSKEEMALLSRLNTLGIGPMGLGGDNTVLGIKIEKASCHTASLPVAINFQCWANRYASIELR